MRSVLVLVAPSVRRYGHGKISDLAHPVAASCRLWLFQRRHASNQTHSAPGPRDDGIDHIRNIGIIAHVDAGKTTTTERMLYYSGMTRHLGNVDSGDTITDFLPMERQRGITIQSAAITFRWPLAHNCPPGTAPKTINLIDTPGHQDFRFEVDRCLPILDGAVCVIDGVKGVEAHTERVWSSAQQFQIPRIIFINKLDRDGASVKKSVTDIASRLNSWPLVCQLPMWDGDAFVGVVDVIRGVGLRWSSVDKFSILPRENLAQSPGLLEELDTARANLIEKLCDLDEELLEEFTETGNDLPVASIKRSLRRSIADGSGTVVPVFMGSSLRNLGVEPLLDAVNDYLPSPKEAGSPEVSLGRDKTNLDDVLSKGSKKTTLQIAKPSTHHAPVGAVAVVFKVVNDPNILGAARGMLSYVRVYHGALHKNSQVWNANLGVFEKPLNIMQVSAAKISEVTHLAEGQIGAITGLKQARTGDTLLVLPSHSHKSPSASIANMTIRPPDMTPPVAFISMEPYSISEMKNLERAVEEISREDPSLRWSKDEKLDTFTLSGMGKLHLDVCIDRLKTHYKVNAVFSDIKVDYKECLTAALTPRRSVCDKVVAGKAGKAACSVSLQPIEAHHDSLLASSMRRDGNYYHVKIDIPQDEVLKFDPELVRRQLFNGAYSAMARGPRRGSPLHGCDVIIEFNPETDYFGAGTDGQIVQAAFQGVKQALKEAHAQNSIGIMEPVMSVNIYCPEDTAGAIQHDISSSRGGTVHEVKGDNSHIAEGVIDMSQVYIPPDPYEMRGSLRDRKKGVTRMLEIVAKVPLQEMLDYDNALRSKTGGRHSLTMDLDTFQRVVGPRERNL